MKFALSLAAALLAFAAHTTSSASALYQLLSSYDSQALGIQPNARILGGSNSLSIDGRYYVFASRASNLVDGQQYILPNYFVFDRSENSVRAVGSAADYDTDGFVRPIWQIQIAASAPDLVFFITSSIDILSLIPDFPTSVAFLPQIVRVDLSNGSVSLVSGNSAGSPATELASIAGVSANGRHVAFSSHAQNLGGPPASGNQMYLKDLTAGTLSRISLSALGAPLEGDASSRAFISSDGTAVSFNTFNSSATGAWMYKRQDGFARPLCTTALGEPFDSPCYVEGASADNSLVFLSTNANNIVPEAEKGFLYRMRLADRALVTVAWRDPFGSSFGGKSVAVSHDGGTAVICGQKYDPPALPGLPHAYLWRDSTGANTLESRTTTGDPVALGISDNSACNISGDGRFLQFASRSPDVIEGLRNGADNAFVKDLLTGVVALAARSSAPIPSASVSGTVGTLRRDSSGRYASFVSRAGNLVSGYSGGSRAAYIIDVQTLNVQLASVPTVGQFLDSDVTDASVSTSGLAASFASSASNLPGPNSTSARLFRRELPSGTATVVNQDDSGAVRPPIHPS